MSSWSVLDTFCALIPDTRYQIPDTIYQIRTRYQIPDTRSHKPSLLFARYQIPNTRYQIPDTRYQIPDTRYQIQDTRYIIPDTYHIPHTRSHKPSLLFAREHHCNSLPKFIFFTLLYRLNHFKPKPPRRLHHLVYPVLLLLLSGVPVPLFTLH